MPAKAVALIEKFWRLMITNDFRSVGSVLSDDFVLEWPQSNERIRGRDNYAAMNEEYPAQGRWQFSVNRIVGNDSEAVSDVSVTDGVQKARAISFLVSATKRSSRWWSFGPSLFPPEKIENTWLRRSNRDSVRTPPACLIGI